MIRASFNDNWQFRPKVNPFAELAGTAVPFEPVTVPHDAMITRDREATIDGAATAYFPGGAYEYRKTFLAPEEHRGKRITMEFEGVYRDATVFINGNYAGQRPYGYSRFFIDADRFLRFGEDNEVRVECRTQGAGQGRKPDRRPRLMSSFGLPGGWGFLTDLYRSR
ncbi:sugar-binding domain-containing protein [Nonomuraea aurantiaca]|uniref:sugar-binding domain-containing protein n=1 Tax=Nonomuraea aurantiaca TaxID=2878562 RepID=UPI001CDA52C3|nr:sugar-binding domain-containing protein [Nonomuraea aurantiaca]MCA2225951.1 hypothetical protein [Nonomuraea aurantiaca]